MEEIWKDIEGYEGFYQVSNLGNVKTLHYRGYGGEKIMKKTLNKQGYEVVRLKGKLFLVHRLVAKAFIPNPKDYPIINHMDEIKNNNFVDNLEWCNYKHNANYGTAIERRVEARKRPIFAITKDDDIEFYDCISDAARILHADENCIRCALKKIQKTSCDGRIWDYQDRFI